MAKKKRIGDVLVEQGTVSKEALEAALAEDTGERIAESLLAKGLVSKDDLGLALQALLGVTYVERPPETIDPKVLALVPAEVVIRCFALPLKIDEETSSLVVAMAEPQNMEHVNELQFSSGMKISPKFSFRSDVIQGIKTFYGSDYQFRPHDTAPTTPQIPASITSDTVNWRHITAVVATFFIAVLAGWTSGYLVARSGAPVAARAPLGSGSGPQQVETAAKPAGSAADVRSPAARPAAQESVELASNASPAPPEQ